MELTRRSLGLAALSVGASALRPARAARKLYDAIVLGAGVAGLNAAWLLEQQGLSVLVLEARNRVGGRVLTLFDQPGLPEMGFNSMGAGYGRGIDAAHRAGVKLVDVAPRQAKSFRQELVLGGRVIPRGQWPTDAANPFPPQDRGRMPWEMVPQVIATRNPLKSWATWLDPDQAALDISMHDFLRAQGLDEAAIRLAFDTSPYYGRSAADVSALMFEFNAGWAATQRAAGPQSFAIEGGNQKLPMAMRNLLHGDVLLGREVVGISTQDDGATVRARDGTSWRGRHIVCALPFSTLRRISVTPGLSGMQAQAVQTLPYQPLSIAFLTVKAPFWNDDGLAPSMWTDGGLGNVLAQYFGPDPEAVSGLMVQARGERALAWDRMGRDAALRMIVAELAAIRPASRGRVEAAALHSWALEPFNAGDWAYFAPGQISRFGRLMSAQAGRLHFCGEHTATANRGLEGALESSERAALEVLAA